MDQLFIWLHIFMQVSALVLGIIAMRQGVQRVSQSHFKKKILFPWKQHVRWGRYAMLLWLAGALGFYVTHSMFGATHMTGSHANVAWGVMALCVGGLISGEMMDRKKKRRFWIPVIHGVLNVLLIILVFFELWTGLQLCPAFL